MSSDTTPRSLESLPISLVIIAHNEEANIERCIRSAGVVSEVVVVDSGSSDKTCEIARFLGAKVEHLEWQGFGKQKQAATRLAKFDWILSLDCDEALSPEALQELVEIFPKLDTRTGYFFPRLSFHLGRWIRHGGWYPDYQLRLFNRKYSSWSEARIHEAVKSERREFLKSPIQHFVFTNLSEQVLTNNRYSGLQAEDVIQKGKKFSILRLLFKPTSKFFECYFLKLGFLDGLPGFIIAVGAAYSVFLRWAKVWEQTEVKK